GALQRAVVLAGGGPITPAHLSDLESAAGSTGPGVAGLVPPNLTAGVRAFIRQLLRQGGPKAHARTLAALHRLLAAEEVSLARGEPPVRRRDENLEELAPLKGAGDALGQSQLRIRSPKGADRTGTAEAEGVSRVGPPPMAGVRRGAGEAVGRGRSHGTRPRGG